MCINQVLCVWYQQTKLDSLQGADPETLEARVKQHYGDGEGEETEDTGVPGHVSIVPYYTIALYILGTLRNKHTQKSFSLVSMLQFIKIVLNPCSVVIFSLTAY